MGEFYREFCFFDDENFVTEKLTSNQTLIDLLLLISSKSD